MVKTKKIASSYRSPPNSANQLVDQIQEGEDRQHAESRRLAGSLSKSYLEENRSAPTSTWQSETEYQNRGVSYRGSEHYNWNKRRHPEARVCNDDDNSCSQESEASRSGCARPSRDPMGSEWSMRSERGEETPTNSISSCSHSQTGSDLSNKDREMTSNRSEARKSESQSRSHGLEYELSHNEYYQDYSKVSKTKTEESTSEMGSLFLVRPTGEDGMWKAYRQYSGKDNIIKVIRTNGSNENKKDSFCIRSPLTKTDKKSNVDSETVGRQFNRDSTDGTAGDRISTSSSLRISGKSESVNDFQNDNSTFKGPANFPGVTQFPDPPRNKYFKDEDGHGEPIVPIESTFEPLAKRTAETRKYPVERKTRGEILKLKRLEMAENKGNLPEHQNMDWPCRNVSQIDKLCFQNSATDMIAHNSPKQCEDRHEKATCFTDGNSLTYRENSIDERNRKSDGDEASKSDNLSGSSRVSLRLIDHLQQSETRPEQRQSRINLKNAKLSGYYKDQHPDYNPDETSNAPPQLCSTGNAQRKLLQRSEFVQSTRSLTSLKSFDSRIKHKPLVESPLVRSTIKNSNVQIQEYNDNNSLRDEVFSPRAKPVKSSSVGVQVCLDTAPVVLTRDRSCQYSPPWPSAHDSDLESVSTQASTVCSNCKSLITSREEDFFQAHSSPLSTRIVKTMAKLVFSNTTLSEYTSDRGHTVWETPYSYCNDSCSSGFKEVDESASSCRSAVSSTKYEDVNTCCCHSRRDRRLFRNDSPPPSTNCDRDEKSKATSKKKRPTHFDGMETTDRRRHVGKNISNNTNVSFDHPLSNTNSNHSGDETENIMKQRGEENTKEMVPCSIPSLKFKKRFEGISSMQQLHKMVESAKMKTHSSTPKEDVNTNFSTHTVSRNEDETTSYFIGEYLYRLWKHQCLCDVKVQVGNISFYAHKLVLAAFSDVFCPTSPQPVASVSFEVPDTSPDAVYEVLRYLYTSTMELKDLMLEPIMSAALFMGICEVVDIVKEILSRPTMENMELYCCIKKNFGLQPDINDYRHIFEENFIEMIETKSFMELSADDVLGILQDPDVMVESELDTIRAIANWIEFNPLDRMDHLARMLSLVNFECIQPETIAAVTEDYPHLFSTPDSQRIISSAYRFHALKNTPGSDKLLFDGHELKGCPILSSAAPTLSVFQDAKKDFLKRRTPERGNNAMRYGNRTMSNSADISSGGYGSRGAIQNKQLCDPLSVWPEVPDYAAVQTTRPRMSSRSCAVNRSHSNDQRCSVTFLDDRGARETTGDTNYCCASPIQRDVNAFGVENIQGRERCHPAQSSKMGNKVMTVRGYSPSTRTKVVSFRENPSFDVAHTNNNALSPLCRRSPTQVDNRRETCDRFRESLKKTETRLGDDLDGRQRQGNRVRFRSEDREQGNKRMTALKSKPTREEKPSTNRRHQRVYDNQSSHHDTQRRGSDNRHQYAHQKGGKHPMLDHDDHMSAFQHYSRRGVWESGTSSRSRGQMRSSDWDKLSENLSFFSPESDQGRFYLEENQNNSSHKSSIMSSDLGTEPQNYEILAQLPIQNELADFTSVPILRQNHVLNQLSRQEIDEFLSDVNENTSDTTGKNITPCGTQLRLNAHQKGSTRVDNKITLINCSDDVKLNTSRVKQDQPKSNASIWSTDTQMAPTSQRNSQSNIETNNRNLDNRYNSIGEDEFEHFIRQRIQSLDRID